MLWYWHVFYEYEYSTQPRYRYQYLILESVSLHLCSKISFSVVRQCFVLFWVFFFSKNCHGHAATHSLETTKVKTFKSHYIIAKAKSSHCHQMSQEACLCYVSPTPSPHLNSVTSLESLQDTFSWSERCGKKLLSLRSFAAKIRKWELQAELENPSTKMTVSQLRLDAAAATFFFVRTYVVFCANRGTNGSAEGFSLQKHTVALLQNQLSKFFVVLCGWQGGSTLRPAPPLAFLLASSTGSKAKNKWSLIKKERKKLCPLQFFFPIMFSYLVGATLCICSPWMFSLLDMSNNLKQLGNRRDGSLCSRQKTWLMDPGTINTAWSSMKTNGKSVGPGFLMVLPQQGTKRWRQPRATA